MQVLDGKTPDRVFEAELAFIRVEPEDGVSGAAVLRETETVGTVQPQDITVDVVRRIHFAKHDSLGVFKILCSEGYSGICPHVTRSEDFQLRGCVHILGYAYFMFFKIINAYTNATILIDFQLSTNM